jgi:hypothetical protein
MAESDSGVPRLQQPGDAIQQSGFSGARRTEQNCYSRANLNVNVQFERSLMPDCARKLDSNREWRRSCLTRR